MGVDHVEGVVGQVERVHVSDDEVDVAHAAPLELDPGQVEGLGGGLQRGDPARRDERGEVGGDGAGPAADVEQAHPRLEVAQQVAGGVLRGAPAVRAQHRGVVAVGVRRGGAHLAHGRSPQASQEDRSGWQDRATAWETRPVTPGVLEDFADVVGFEVVGTTDAEARRMPRLVMRRVPDL